MYQENKEIIIKIIQTLRKHNHTLSFAESCTGGRLAVAFTSVSGASAILNGSMVTYSNAIKQKWLGVEEAVLTQFGAVSSQCVTQMLEGIHQQTKAEYTLAVSGIAGPTGGTEFKPVGTVYIGLKTPHSKEVFHCLFQGDREAVQQQSTTFAIEKLAESLNI